MTFLNIFYVLLPFIALIINLSSQIVILRLNDGEGFFKSVVLGFLVGLSFLIIIDIIYFDIKIFGVSNYLLSYGMNILSYCFLSLCYFTFLNMGVSALRIRLLNELEDNPKGLTTDEILIKYNSQEIINRRINKLASNKQISYKDQRYYSKKSITLLMVFIKEFLSLIFFRKKPRIKFKKVK